MKKYFPHILISGALFLFCAMYFGGSQRGESRESVDKSRMLASQTMSEEEVLQYAELEMPQDLKVLYDSLKSTVVPFSNDEENIERLKSLSRLWYQSGNYGMSGYYAMKIAKSNDEEEAWSIAGIQFSAALDYTKEPRYRSFLYKNAQTAFGRAQQINPDSEQHKINMAVAHVKGSPAPMQGVGILKGMLEENPDNINVLLKLAELSVNLSGDVDKALPRLEKILSLDENHLKGNYYLGKIYYEKGLGEQALPYLEKYYAIQKSEGIIDPTVGEWIAKIKN